MTAMAALEHVDHLIAVSTQRLQPLALQRLSIAEILGENAGRKILPIIPSTSELGVTAVQEPAYMRLVKFLQVHEPTGHERDVAHKRDVVRFLAIGQMLHECRLAKLPDVQAACVDKLLQWFDETATSGSGAALVSASASTPILPPRMSPKKPMSATPALGRSSSQDGLPASGEVDLMAKAFITQKLERYKMPNLRASHIRRVAQLRTRGTDVPPDALAIPAPEDSDSDLDDAPLGASEYARLVQHAQVKATFQVYEPETEAEFAMNQMWLERQRDLDIEQKEEQEVQARVQSWSMNKSRDESEFLRRHESMQLAAGLDKMCQETYEAVHPRRRHLDKKRNEWHALQQTAPKTTSAREHNNSGVGPTTTKTGDPLAENDHSDNNNGAAAAPASTPSRPGSVLVVKRKKSTSGGPGTPIGPGGGGMHFRNQLPANFTPQGRKSSGGFGTPSSSSSRDSRSTPNTPLSSSSSGKLMLLDEAATQAEGRGLHYKEGGSPQTDDSPTVDDDDGDDVAARERRERPYQFDRQNQQTTLKFSERAEETRPTLKFQPFYPTTHTQQGEGGGGVTLSRAVSAPGINRKLYPRGTIVPQPEPVDPEYRHLHAAAASRKPPLPASFLPDKPFGLSRNTSALKLGTVGSNNQQEAVATSLPVASARRNSLTAGDKRGGVNGSSSSTATLLSTSTSGGSLMSDLRAEQMYELDRIRVLFEQHNLPFAAGIMQQALLVPEDRATAVCVQNLPLPGARLVSNPLLQVRVKAGKGGKKKKKKGTKKKKTKGGASGAKSPKKSPKKKKK